MLVYILVKSVFANPALLGVTALSLFFMFVETVLMFLLQRRKITVPPFKPLGGAIQVETLSQPSPRRNSTSFMLQQP